jgi:hypothetical protein
MNPGRTEPRLHRNCVLPRDGSIIYQIPYSCSHVMCTVSIARDANVMRIQMPGYDPTHVDT